MALSNCCLILAVSLFSASVGQAAAQSSTPSPVPLIRSRTHLLVVSARINGRGPFKFILDTGSNITLIESSLFRDLDLKGVGRPSAKVIDWMALGKLAVADEISLEGGPSRNNLRVLEVDGIKRPDLDHSIRGVLGEDFLSGFDLLIDNRRHAITFDTHNLLSSSLDGEHLAMTVTAGIRGVQVNNRPLVSARVVSAGAVPLQLLLDTGSESIYLVSRPETDPATARVATTSDRAKILLSSSPPCVSWKDRLLLGRTTTPKAKMISCLKSPPAVSDNDGTLPTFIFDRIFISHAGGYLILNPVEIRAIDRHSIP
jgi:hypothetical protein